MDIRRSGGGADYWTEQWWRRYRWRWGWQWRRRCLWPSLLIFTVLSWNRLNLYWILTAENNDFVLFCLGLVFDCKEWKQNSKATLVHLIAVKKKALNVDWWPCLHVRLVKYELDFLYKEWPTRCALCLWVWTKLFPLSQISHQKMFSMVTTKRTTQV